MAALCGRRAMIEVLLKLHTEPVARQYRQVKLVMQRDQNNKHWEFHVVNPETGDTLDQQHEDALEWVSWY